MSPSLSPSLGKITLGKMLIISRSIGLFSRSSVIRRPLSRPFITSRSCRHATTVNAITTASPSKLQRANDLYLSRKVPELFSLKDHVIAITGGARGIGLALAFAVAEVGGKVAIIDAAKQPHEHYSKLSEICSQVQYYSADVTNYHSLKGAFDQVVTEFGRIDGCITAAGVCPDQPFLQRKPEDVKRCLDINVLGTYFTAQLTAERIVEQEKQKVSPQNNFAAGVPQSAGSIVLIASVAAHQASKGQYVSDYAASKGAVLSLTKELGVELAPHGIRVNCISPGYIMTDMMVDIADVRPDLADIVTTEPPMKRMGDRVDLKAAAVYLLSEASAYMTGSEMLITGGLHAR